MTIEKDIKQAIEQHLPQQVGEVLQKQLKKLSDIEKKNEELEMYKINSQRHVEELKQKLSDAEKTLARTEDLERREGEVAETERGLVNAILQVQLKAANTTNDRIMDFVDSLMRNTTYRRTAFPQVQTSWDSSGNPINVFESDPSAETTAE